MNTNNNINDNRTNEINDEINGEITEQEIRKTIKQLKNNKSPGIDQIVNEQLKYTVNTMMPIYVKLFNVILNTGIIPESWTIGLIKPIYKNKGDPDQPENYGPISLLRTFEKLFTCLLNSRLNTYAE